MSPAAVLAVIGAQWLALALIMTAAWGVERRTGNSGYIDTIWAFGTGLTGAVFAVWPLGFGPQTSPRQIVVAVMMIVWGFRLGWHIMQRSKGRAEDPRYGDLVKQWGERATSQMFVLLQKQAIVTVALVFGVFCAAHNPAASLSAQDAIAIAVFSAAVLGEALADRQLRAYIANPANRGRICDVGLWRYSRHPNYFFEWLHWLAYPIAAINLAGDWRLGWFAVLAPLTMYWLLVHVSGVPPLEDHMLRRHGARFRAYQARTNAFIPGPPKHV